MTQYFCCDERRRAVIRGQATLNGLDYLEVLDDPALPFNQRQRTLFVHFVNPPTALAVTAANVRITGGVRVRNVAATSAMITVDPRSGSAAPVLVVETDKTGDFSIYTLQLVEDAAHPGLLAAIDPILRSVDFSFKAACDSDFDAAMVEPCGAPAAASPLLDYTARDFRGLLQMLLDRAATTMPDWTERHAADLGVTLLELFAYVGDHFSYRQDAISAEAYLPTARRRISVRRHARLVDYAMHDGCAARLWAHVHIEGGALLMPEGVKLLTTVAGVPSVLPATGDTYDRAIAAGAEVFETLEPASLDPALNEIRLHTWGDGRCCLPTGATTATLRGDLTALLRPGDRLLFQEVASPVTGAPADADPAHRQVVVLTQVTAASDPIGGAFEEPPTSDPLAVTQIAWAPGDALTFPLTISAQADENFGAAIIDPVSVARGNLVLADHGRTLAAEALGTVPRPWLTRRAARKTEDTSLANFDQADPCARDMPEPIPIKWRPKLGFPLAFAVPYDPANRPASAAAAIQIAASNALPAIDRLASVDAASVTTLWQPRRDLLNSVGEPDFVAETDDDGRAVLRFGDGTYGIAPPAGATFSIVYRTGGGDAGNIGADAIGHLASDDPGVLAAGITLTAGNPLPAAGGLAPESKEAVRRLAPYAFRTQERVVTPQDYADRAGLFPGVQRGAATLRWTGSWHTHFLSVDRQGGALVVDDFLDALTAYLETYRLAGQDVRIEQPVNVGIELDLTVAVAPDQLRAEVRQSVRDVLSARVLADGSRGLFHPDNLTFGQTLYLSPIYAAVQAVAGVTSVTVTLFQRLDAPGPQGLIDGKLEMGRLEIARLDSDPNQPEHGVVRLTLEGGR